MKNKVKVLIAFPLVLASASVLPKPLAHSQAVYARWSRSFLDTDGVYASGVFRESAVAGDSYHWQFSSVGIPVAYPSLT
jgi:hypothetical protein